MKRRDFVKTLLAASGCFAFGQLPSGPAATKQLHSPLDQAPGFASYGSDSQTHLPNSLGCWAKLPHEKEWHHIMVSLRPTGTKCYIDGEPLTGRLFRLYQRALSYLTVELGAIRRETRVVDRPDSVRILFGRTLEFRGKPKTTA